MTSSVIMVSSCISCSDSKKHDNQLKTQNIHLSLNLNLTENLLRSTFGDTTSDGQVGVLLKVQINLASSLATFVDTPEVFVSIFLQINYN